MKKGFTKFFTLLTILALGVGQVWGQDTLFHWRSAASTSKVESATAALVGTYVFTGSAQPSSESASYATGVSDDMKATGSKGNKLGSSTLYFGANLSGSYKLAAGDTIYVCGYNPYRIGSTMSSNKAGTDIASALATGTSKTDYQVGKIGISAAMIESIGENVSTIYFSRSEGSGTGLAAIMIVRPASTPATKYTVTYDLNGGTGTLPTQEDVAKGGKFTLHDGTTDITAPAGQKFDGWHDGTTKYAGGAEYTMGESNVTLTAQWVENVPDPTASFADATYIIGQSALDMSAKFTSNSSGSVTYSLKEATSDASITSAGSFTATAAGTYVVVASQEAVAGTYAAISKEATVTVLDSEVADTYIWKKGTGYTGCVTSPNADAPAAQYTEIAYEGFTGMGRAAADNTECLLTFSVKAAYSATFGIKSICTYGKLEEPAGGQISWDGGTTWENLAAYAEGKKEFNAPAATFPTSFKIRFLGVSASSGGLYWRNALVTLEVKKTVSSVTEALVGAEINGATISSENLATLLANKTLNIATAYAAAPTVTFKKQVTTTYEGGWAPDVTNVDVEVTSSDNTTAWQAIATINAQAYTINIAKPAGPSLETEATAFTLTSAKIATDTKSFTFSGVNLAHSVTIALESDVAGMTVTPAVVIPTDNAITNQEVTITYKSLENVAEAVVNLVVAYDVDTKITIPLTYSSTAGYEDLTPISAATTWNWDGAASAAYGTLGQNDMIILANADVTWDEGFNARAIAGALQHYYRDGKYAQGNSLKFNTTIPGKVYVKFSNTGGKDIARAPRITDANGTYAPTDESEGSKNTTAIWFNHSVAAGDVLIEGFEMKDPIALNMLRYYEVRFVPVFAVTYDAGEGSVKGGETMPTQADEAAGEKIILAAATALEKDGYDFAGWLCDIDAQTYQPGDEYTMTAAATTFTAQWVLHVDPVDPTLTYDDGDYMVGSVALDLSSLITEKTSTGAITYSVKDAGTTGAAIDGNNFTATAAGTATITASQAAVLGYNAKTVDFSVVVTEATEIDGIKLVEAGALTGNFITGSSLSNGEYTIEGIHYEKYLKFGSTFSGSYGNGARTNYIFYDLKKENTTFYVYAHNNTSTAGKIIVYTYNTASAKYAEVPVAASENAIKSFSLNDIDANTRVFIGVDNTNIYFCQVVAVESGAGLMKGGQAGYSIDFSAKSRFSSASGAAITLDGMEFVTSSGYTPNSSTEVALGAIGTNYVKFVLDTKTLVEVKTNSTNQYYIGSTYAAEEETSKTYGYKPAVAGETHSFELEAGTWYLNPNTSNIKLQKLAFMLPKCAEPSFDALANSDICSGNPYVALDGTATVTDAGTVSYKWYAEGADESDPAAVIGTNATYLPSADGKYYVIATNSLSGYTDNVKKSDLVSVTTFASAEITTAPENVRKDVGQEATLTVVASGKNLSYEWFTCDDESGTNPVAIVPAETNASLTVTVAAGTQWYKVVVSSDCGDAFAVAKVEEWTELPQVTVTASTEWNFATAVAGSTTLENQTDVVLANIPGITNNATFNSQALVGTFNKMPGNYFQGNTLSFTTDKKGLLIVTFRGTNNNDRVLKVYDDAENEIAAWNYKGSGTGAEQVQQVEVPAGKVTLRAFEGTDAQNARIYNLKFFALGHSRDVTPGNLGTLCLPNACIARGVDVYELVGKEATYGKIVFADLEPDDLLVAGQAYIFQVNEATARFYYAPGEPVDAPLNNTALKGNLGSTITFQPNSPEAENVYFVKDHALWSAKETGVNIGQYRAYLQMDDVSNVTNPSPAPGRRYIMLGTNGTNVATGIDDVQDDVRSTKMLIDGRLFILRGEKIYDATGRLVK